MINNSWLHPQWQPIDYSQAEAGNAPFDGERCFVKAIDFDNKKVVHSMRWYAPWGRFVADREGAFSYRTATHWISISEFLKG